MTFQVVDEVESTGVELILHVRLSFVEHLPDLLLDIKIGEISVKNLYERCSLDQIFQSWYVGTETPCNVSPDHCILMFGVDESAIEVEESSFKILHTNGCEILLNEFAKIVYLANFSNNYRLNFVIVIHFAYLCHPE